MVYEQSGSDNEGHPAKHIRLSSKPCQVSPYPLLLSPYQVIGATLPRPVHPGQKQATDPHRVTHKFALCYTPLLFSVQKTRVEHEA